MLTSFRKPSCEQALLDCVGVARTEDNPRSYEAIRKARTQNGIKLLYKNPDGTFSIHYLKGLGVTQDFLNVPMTELKWKHPELYYQEGTLNA